MEELLEELEELLDRFFLAFFFLSLDFLSLDFDFLSFFFFDFFDFLELSELFDFLEEPDLLFFFFFPLLELLELDDELEDKDDDDLFRLSFLDFFLSFDLPCFFPADPSSPIL